MNKENKFKKVFKGLGFILIFGIIGCISGIVLGPVIGEIEEFELTDAILILVSFISAFMFQIILHEAGHLVFGLLSGYEFISFRVGSITLIKENGKFAIKKFKIQGTGGQCLMMPKAKNYKEYKFILYNLGGVLMNLLISIVALGVFSLYPYKDIFNTFLVMVVISGIIIIITNGIPLKIGGLPNDGYNTVSIKKSDIIKYCFYIQLKVTGLIYRGERIKDMPIEWFCIDKDVDYTNPLITVVKCMEANYYHDKLDFVKAKECYKQLLEDTPNILKLYENEINCEILFYEIIGDRDKEVIDRLYTKDLKRYIKATECYITRKRLMYAYYLLIENDIDMSNKLQKEFKDLIKTYPSKGEIYSEIEVMEFVKTLN